MSLLMLHAKHSVSAQHAKRTWLEPWIVGPNTSRLESERRLKLNIGYFYDKGMPNKYAKKYYKI